MQKNGFDCGVPPLPSNLLYQTIVQGDKTDFTQVRVRKLRQSFTLPIVSRKSCCILSGKLLYEELH